MDLYNKIQIYKTQNEMVEAAGRLILKVAKNAVDVNGQFVISLSGGQTPQLLYCLLSKPPYSNEMPWGKTFVFWGDERCVPQNDAQNNAYMAKTLLLDHIEIPPNNIYPIPVNLPPAAAAKEYEQTIKSFFK